MCNEHRRSVALGQIAEDWSQLRIPLRFPEGAPNLAPLDSIRITDPTAIIRASREKQGAVELVTRRWSWPGPGGRPVFNFRSEGRRFDQGRCLIVADGFYEYTDRKADKEGMSVPEGRAKGRKKKDRWLFTRPDGTWFCIAGLWRNRPEVGEACTMLTTEAGPDVAPYHDRQIVVFDLAQAAQWLDPAIPAATVLKPSPAGSFDVTAANQ